MTPKRSSRSQPLPLVTERLKGALRALMKRKNRSYQELADHLEVSLATIKRVLTHEEISLTRLLEICDWLQISLSDLEAAAQKEEPADNVHMTEDQELFLAEDPRFHSYLNLLWDGMTPAQIAKQRQLTSASTELYLRRLDQHGLIRVTGAGRVVTAYRKQPNWRSRGPLAQLHFRRITEAAKKFFDQLFLRKISHVDESDAASMHMTASDGEMLLSTYEAMSREMTEVIKRFSDLSHHERKISDPSKLGRYVMHVQHTWLKPQSKLKSPWDIDESAVSNLR